MTPPANRTYKIVAVIVKLYMVGALAISFHHIVTAAAMLRLDGWQAWTVPFAIDGFAVLGMIGRSDRFAASTQRTGLRLQALAGLVSLAANVYAGRTIGERAYGALVVAAFLVAEWYAGKLRPAPAPVATVSAVRSQAAQRGAVKAAATRAANAAAKREAEQRAAVDAAAKREARRIARAVKASENMAATFAATAAPVSPSPYL